MTGNIVRNETLGTSWRSVEEGLLVEKENSLTILRNGIRWGSERLFVSDILHSFISAFGRRPEVLVYNYIITFVKKRLFNTSLKDYLADTISFILCLAPRVSYDLWWVNTSRLIRGSLILDVLFYLYVCYHITLLGIHKNVFLKSSRKCIMHTWFKNIVSFIAIYKVNKTVN